MDHIILKDGRKKELSRMEIMGIINVTPDSFYEGSRVDGVGEALERASKMIEEGATFLDVGGESTRPGAANVPEDVEAERVCPVIKAIKERWPEILVSVDTYRASTAEKAIDAGADIVNDISGLTYDKDMVRVVAKAGVPVIIMHSGRTDILSEEVPVYEDVVKEVYDFLSERIDYAIRNGIRRDRILTDVGLGFGKSYKHNMQLLGNLEVFNDLGCPGIVAASRKSFIGKVLGKEDPKDRLTGTLVITAFAERRGMSIVRVHDVAENMDAIRMMEALGEASLADPEVERPSEKTCRLVISLGSNIGDRQHYLDMALFDMERRLGKIIARSEVIETEPYGYEEQDNFLNMAAVVETTFTPEMALDALMDIEKNLDRVREIHWGPRTIDLDIVYADSMVIDTDRLKVPHPDRLNRDFVLGPVSEIAPDLVDPLEKKTVAQLYQELKHRE